MESLGRNGAEWHNVVNAHPEHSGGESGAVEGSGTRAEPSLTSPSIPKGPSNRSRFVYLFFLFFVGEMPGVCNSLVLKGKKISGEKVKMLASILLSRKRRFG